MTALLDVNTLVAITWPNHVHHHSAVRWFTSHHQQGWATCPISESGFVRVSSNPKVIQTASSVGDAIQVLRQLRQQSGHSFWADDISIATCTEVDVSRLAGFRQVTDAHLLAIAIRNKGQLVTFDKALRSLAPTPEAVELLSL